MSDKNENEGFDRDEWVERVRAELKNQLERDKDYMTGNWRDKLDELIKDKQKELEDEKKRREDEENPKEEDTEDGTDKDDKDAETDNGDSLDAGETDKDVASDDTYVSSLNNDQKKIIKEFENKQKDATQDLIEFRGTDESVKNTRCPSGYEYRPQSGIDCVQIACDTVHDQAHYSYTGHCICGSAGSIAENPKDPNTACKFPAEFASCPGCTYTCIHSDEKCPL